MEFVPVAHIENDFKEKFGIPKQGGIAASMRSRVVFEGEYADPVALRGIEGFSHIWLLWEFSKSKRGDFSPTVRPPVLGGNERMGVFATRSPNRPNPIGMTSVRLERAVLSGEGAPYLIVSGADLLDGTPIYDVKPYIAGDCHPDAREGFNSRPKPPLDVVFDEECEGAASLSPLYRQQLTEILSADPRPQYQDDPERVYGMHFADLNVRFRVEGGKLTVISAGKYPQER